MINHGTTFTASRHGGPPGRSAMTKPHSDLGVERRSRPAGSAAVRNDPVPLRYRQHGLAG
jgi:hypothetical protein